MCLQVLIHSSTHTLPCEMLDRKDQVDRVQDIHTPETAHRTGYPHYSSRINHQMDHNSIYPARPILYLKHSISSSYDLKLPNIPFLAHGLNNPSRNIQIVRK